MIKNEFDIQIGDLQFEISHNIKAIRELEESNADKLRKIRILQLQRDQTGHLKPRVIEKPAGGA